MMNYKDFEMRPLDDGRWELVKWQGHHSSCFTIAVLIPREDEDWKMESCGLRYLEYREDGLEDYILAVLKLVDVCNKENENDA